LMRMKNSSGRNSGTGTPPCPQRAQVKVEAA
jgi:hypothetical protein